MSEIELKPCPFCGGEAVIHVSDGVAVICRECGAASKCLVDGHLQGKPDGRAIKSVIKAWNTRKPMERIAEQLEELDNNGWIPVEERLPEDDKYILLSFKNFSLPLIGSYQREDDGGAFYLGDCDREDTCVANGLFVNAWMPLPEPYNQAKEGKK